MELTTGVTNAQSPDGGVLVQFGFYSPCQQQTLTFRDARPDAITCGPLLHHELQGARG